MEFSDEVIERIGFYVYRLIDPRNGETFYVGKGRGNRVFQHVRGAVSKSNDEIMETDKIKRIRKIQLAGLSVTHVIHRHGLEEDVAFEVEGALIDAFPSTTNIAGGRSNINRGAMHASQIIENYEAEIACIEHKIIAISINQTAHRLPVYDAVRFAWRVNVRRAEATEYVLAVHRGIIVGVFRVEEWLPANAINFPGFVIDPSCVRKHGFNGEPAENDIADIYLRKKLSETQAIGQIGFTYLEP